jgi:hypothetical protein
MQFQHQIFFNKSTHKAQISLAMNNLIILHSRRSGQAPPLCTRVLLKLYPYVHSRKFKQEFLCNFNAIWHQFFFKKPMHKAQLSLAMNNLIICLHSRRSGQGPLCTRVLPTWVCLASEGERAKGYTLNIKHQDSHKGGATPAKKLRSK